jgi:hypothetical protein
MDKETIKGIKHDEDKLRWDLLPLEPIEDAIRVLMFGAKNYGKDNWKLIETYRWYNAIRRHNSAWKKGQIYDEETGLPHMAHIIANAIFIHYQDQNEKEKEKELKMKIGY